MSDWVIQVEHLGKKYRIGGFHGPYRTLRETITNTVTGPFRRRPDRKPLDSGGGIIWALKDVSFRMKQGEILGIIGPNGAGKSTLLKILSRITEPTEGRVTVRGRVGSLLEVGTGFHPELTGRENIFLSGAILGMKRDEIGRKFDEIVSFAEVEKFLDTPVKHYSSGMSVRLAFAVAAHLEPEILLVDEVLAVGDMHFQKKCLGKMENVASSGRTILLVSHNMASVLSLSTKCIFISAGQLLDEGSPKDVIRTYQNQIYDKTFGQTDLSAVERYGNGEARFVSIFTRAFDSHHHKLASPVTGCDLEFEIGIKAFHEIQTMIPALIVYDDFGNRIIDVNTLIKGDSLTLAENQKATVTFFLKNVCLKPGTYTVGLWLGIFDVADIDGVRYASSFRMEARREDILYTTPFPGVYACQFEHKIMLGDGRGSLE